MHALGIEKQGTVFSREFVINPELNRSYEFQHFNASLYIQGIHPGQLLDIAVMLHDKDTEEMNPDLIGIKIELEVKETTWRAVSALLVTESGVAVFRSIPTSSKHYRLAISLPSA